MIKQVVILNEVEVLQYIQYEVNRDANTNVCKMDKIKEDIRSQYKGKPDMSNEIYGQYQTDCFPDWDKQHCFRHVGVYEGYLIVYYLGAMK